MLSYDSRQDAWEAEDHLVMSAEGPHMHVELVYLPLSGGRWVTKGLDIVMTLDSL